MGRDRGKSFLSPLTELVADDSAKIVFLVGELCKSPQSSLKDMNQLFGRLLPRFGISLCAECEPV